jgi:translation initiation factor 2 alpha subunit (eIF-2alpha)
MDFEKYLNENPEYKEKYGRLTTEEVRQLAECIRIASEIVETIIPIVREIVKTATAVIKEVISLYPNKRVVYLAVYGKNERTRKKNLHRIIKDMQKWGRAL